MVFLRYSFVSILFGVLLIDGIRAAVSYVFIYKQKIIFLIFYFAAEMGVRTYIGRWHLFG